ncbi:MAG: alkylation response protein AidB-like acyl-CoA dehydrogenase [Saprospiraceae bacterium]|jgi:alkylation response protein AidB-like acyl-CoA dehydrogenase
MKNTQSKDQNVKGGYFVIGETPPEEVFIAEDFDEEANLIGDTVRKFCVKEIQEPFFKNGREFVVTEEDDKAEVLAILKRAGDLGLCGVSIPEAYGGMDLDFKTNTLISSKLSYGFSFATTLGAQTSIGCLPIVYYGNEAQKQKYLPKISSAEYVAAYALTEPNAGSDANSGKTKATLSKDGNHFLINGQKIWITNGGFADVYIVFAKIETDEKLSAFIVERTFEGFSVGAEEKKFGIKGSSTVQIFFDNCKVPVENLLGERQGGFKMALTILNGGRIKAGAGAIGGAVNGLDRAVKYAKERIQFKVPIASFGAIQYKIGDIAMRIFANHAACFRTADLIDKKMIALKSTGLADGPAKIQAISEFAIEASIVKVKGSELVCYALDEAIQIHGGMGYAVETGLGMGYRDARITKIYEGTNDINALLAVGELSKRGIVTKELDLEGAGKKIPGFLLSQLNPFRSKSDDKEQTRIVQGLKYSFLYISGMAGKKLKKKLIEEQEIILNLSTILQEAYVGDTALLKVKKLRGMPDADKSKLDIQEQMVQLYLYEALEKSRKAGLEAIASFSTGIEKRRHTKVVNWLLKPYDINPKTLRRNIAQVVIEQGEYVY